jgi:hypothetical protein
MNAELNINLQMFGVFGLIFIIDKDILAIGD